MSNSIQHQDKDSKRIKIKTAKGVFLKIVRNQEFCGVTNHLHKKLDLTEKQAHQKLGHMSQARTTEIAESLEWYIKEKMGVCAPCAEVKTQQKNIASNSKMKLVNTNDSGRSHLDISSIKLAGHVELEEAIKPYWLIMVDEKTQLKFSNFFTTKHSMIEPTCIKLTDWKTAGRDIKIILCNNAGENIALEKRLKSSDWKSDIVFEYTGRDTPQRNSLAEVSSIH